MAEKARFGIDKNILEIEKLEKYLDNAESIINRDFLFIIIVIIGLLAYTLFN